MIKLLVCMVCCAGVAADLAAGTLAVGSGADASKAGEATVFDGVSLAIKLDKTPYGAFLGGVRVASGDLNGDGRADLIVAPGPGAAPTIVLYNGATGGSLGSFDAYGPSVTGGVFVAAGDIDGDRRVDVVTGVDAGAPPNVRVFSGATNAPLLNFFAYDIGFTGGVRVAAGDVDGDGFADVIVAPGPGTPQPVRIYSGHTGGLLDAYFPYSASYGGGIFVAAADVDGDGRADVVTAPDAGSMPYVSVFSGADHSLLNSFLAYDSAMTAGVRVAAGDIDGDGVPEIVTVSGAGAQVRAFSWPSLTKVRDFFPFSGFSGGAYVATPYPTDVIFADAFGG